MQRNFIEKRRKRPSYFVPILFFSLELILIYLIVSLFNWSMSPFSWSWYTSLFALILVLISLTKLRIVLRRQRLPHD